MKDKEEDDRILCARCTVDVIPGRGEFYVVEINAKADPTPPVLDDSDMKRDYKSEINALVAELENVEPHCQKLTINLCTACYSTWIKKPAGTTDQ